MHRFARWGLYAALLSLFLSPADAEALLLYAKGEAGSLSSVEREVGPSASGPIELLSAPVAAGGRFADFTAHVDAGVVQLYATASATAGAQSVGNWRALVEGSWEDTITFEAPGTIPSLPGVEIIPGVTAGRAELVMTVDGSFNLVAVNNTAFGSYGTSLGYGLLAPFAGRCCGPEWTDFRGSVQTSGKDFPPSPFDGDELPVELRLEVDFIFGEGFDVLFKLSTHAEIGWEGIADGTISAEALLDQTALWGGAQNVRVIVDDMGSPTEIALPDGSWSAASAAVDYTNPITVPEPHSLALLALTVAVGAARRRTP
jgi:hypothetical protein